MTMRSHRASAIARTRQFSAYCHTLLLALFVTAVLSLAPNPVRSAVTPADARALAMDAEQTLIELNYYLSDEYFHTGEFVRAAEALQRVAVLDPQDVDAYATAAWLLWSAKMSAEAEDVYARMIANNPRNSTAYFEVGLYYVRIKKDAEAAPYLEKAVQFGGLPRDQRNLYGHVLTRLQRIDEAMAFWKETLRLDPENTVAQRELDRLAQEQPQEQDPDNTPIPPTLPDVPAGG